MRKLLIIFILLTGIAKGQTTWDQIAIRQTYGTAVLMDTTGLGSLASSATVGRQTAKVSNLATLANDYEISVKFTFANTAPGSDKTLYLYVCPFYTTDGGTTWFATDQGTTTLPTGAVAASTIASPNSLVLLGAIPYTTQQMVCQKSFLLSNAFGNRIPDGFSLIVINFTGAALSTVNLIYYTPLN